MRGHTVPLTAHTPDPSAQIDERVTQAPHRPGALETLSTCIPTCPPPIGDAGLPLHIPYLTVHLLTDTHDTSPGIGTLVARAAQHLAAPETLSTCIPAYLLPTDDTDLPLHDIAGVKPLLYATRPAILPKRTKRKANHSQHLHDLLGSALEQMSPQTHFCHSQTKAQENQDHCPSTTQPCPHPK
jgi:hypothetical protein